MTEHPTLLAVLLEARGLHRYGSFCAAYQRSAGSLDKQLASTVPSRAQFHRWLTGELRSLPYTDHCVVLEHMLTGYSAGQLFQRCPDGGVPPPARDKHDAAVSRTVWPGIPAPVTPGMAGVAAVFASRSEFAAAVEPRSLFENSRRVRAAGLSLNMICQQVPDQQLRRWLASGAELTCLFLDPDGDAIRAREREEEHTAGHLSTLTRLNIDVMSRMRDRLPADARDRIGLAVYDETIRFNIFLVDDHTCVAQPYLPTGRGIDSPTLLIRATGASGGLYPVFEQIYDAIAERARPL